MMRSLRTRLLFGIIVGTISLLVIFSLIVYTAILSALVKQFDSSLTSIAQILAASIEFDLNDNEIELEFEVQQMPEFQNAEKPTYYQLWRADGTIVAWSPLLKTDDLVRPEAFPNTIVFLGIQEKNGNLQREVGLTFAPRNADKDEDDIPPPTSEQFLTLAVARDVGDLYGQLKFLRRLLLTASATVTVLSLLIATIIVRKGLNPLNTIASEIATITEDNLTKRITVEHVPAELVSIKNRLNELMSRLEASFNRERQFNADVAHELRTPLAGIRSTIEVALTRNRDENEYKAALYDCLQIAKNMESVVNNLLILARLETQQISFKTEMVQLSELIASCWGRISTKANERRISFENHIPPELTCQTDPDYLSMVLSNLLDNAVEYADQGGQIRTTARQINDSVEITVSNTGCKLTAEQVSKVTDCFWRGDSSRSDAGIHCGLGLALVQRIVKALGGKFSIQLERGGIFMTKVTLPANNQKTIPA
jgi:signal transduction histidine kinase